jgi:tRNA A37 threonylcarbamoyltransferase TsaD
MSNEAFIKIIETEDGVTVTIASENRTQDNAALIAAVHMVSSFKQICEAGALQLNETRLDLN